MGKVSINITEKKNVFINPETGERMSPAEFGQRYSSTGMGGLGRILSTGKPKEEKGENN